jgi:hypothetical protein
LLLGLGLVLLGHGARSAFRAGRGRARHALGVVRSQPPTFRNETSLESATARGVTRSRKRQDAALRRFSHRVNIDGVRRRSALFPSRRE